MTSQLMAKLATRSLADMVRRHGEPQTRDELAKLTEKAMLAAERGRDSWLSKHEKEIEEYIDPQCRYCEGTGQRVQNIEGRHGHWRGVVLAVDPEAELDLRFGDMVKVNRYDSGENQWHFNAHRVLGIAPGEMIAFFDSTASAAIPWGGDDECALVFASPESVSCHFGNWLSEGNLV